MLAAASLVLTQAGEGSSPSGPTHADCSTWLFGIELDDRQSATDKHWSSSGQDTALVQRLRGFESRPVLLIFDNAIRDKRP